MEAPISNLEAPAAAVANEDPAPAISTTTPAESSAPVSTKPVHSLVIDTNAIIKNEPPVSTLLAQAEQIYTIPAVISESMRSHNLEPGWHETDKVFHSSR